MKGKNIVDLNVLFCDVILMLPCQTLDKHYSKWTSHHMRHFASDAKLFLRNPFWQSQSTIVVLFLFYVLKYKFQI